MTDLIAVPEITGQAFLPCIDTDLYMATMPAGGQRGSFEGAMQASLLLNAKQPGAPPAPLPDMRAVPDDPACSTSQTRSCRPQAPIARE